MSSTTSALFDDALAAKLLISKVKLHGFDRVSEAASNATATPVMHYPPAANLDPSSSSVSPGQQLGSLSCSVCVFASANQPRFDTIQEQRQHFKSDFHALNVKRKLAGKPAVDEAQFEVLLETESLGSLEGSESETDGEEDGDIGGGGGGGGAGGGAGSPFIQLFMPSQSKQPVTSFGMTSTPSSSTNYVFSIYKQVFSHQKKLQHESPESLLALVQARLSLFQRERSRITWTMIMVGSGHFAGAVFQCSTGKALFHKTFHRYTTRRKQGGAQSSNDSSGRFAKSAGAGLRRYNEQALQQEIQELLTTWKSQLKSSDLIFIRAPGSNRKSLFFDSSILDASDTRIRSFPFTTKRPTFSELERCLKELSSVRIQDAVELDQVKQQQQQQHNSIVLNSSKASGSSNIDVAAQLLEKLDLSHAASVVSIPPPSESMLRLIDLCKRGKPDLFKEIVGVLDDNDHNHNNINAAATSAGTILPPDLFDRLPDDVGISLLHIAASSSQPQLVSYLLNLGADPSMRAIGRGGNTRPYDVAGDKDTREAFRDFRSREPDLYDWNQTGIPEPISAEDQERQKQRLREKKKKQKRNKSKKSSNTDGGGEEDDHDEEEEEVVLVNQPVAAKKGGSGALKMLSKTEQQAMGMSPEARALLDREKRALAAEARIRSMQNKCAACSKSLAGLTPFNKLQFKYCSINCVKANQKIHD